MCKKKEECKTDDLTNVINILISYSTVCKNERHKAEEKIVELCEKPETDEYKHYVGVRRIWQMREDDCERAIDAVYSGRIGSIAEIKKEVKEEGCE